MADFEVKDSGKMAEYASGMRRDTTEGKPKFSLMWPENIPYEQQLIYRVAMHYMLGGQKYGDRNWEKSHTEEDLAHHIDATERHLHKFLRGVEDGEDHAAAVVWGINAVLLTRWNMLAKADKAAADDSDVTMAVDGNGPVTIQHHSVSDCNNDGYDVDSDFEVGLDGQYVYSDDEYLDDDADAPLPLSMFAGKRLTDPMNPTGAQPTVHTLYQCGCLSDVHGWGYVNECLKAKFEKAKQVNKDQIEEIMELKPVKRVHSHPMHQSCRPECPQYDGPFGHPSRFEFTGEQVDVERPDTRPGGGL